MVSVLPLWSSHLQVRPFLVCGTWGPIRQNLFLQEANSLLRQIREKCIWLPAMEPEPPFTFYTVYKIAIRQRRQPWGPRPCCCWCHHEALRSPSQAEGAETLRVCVPPPASVFFLFSLPFSLSWFCVSDTGAWLYNPAENRAAYLALDEVLSGFYWCEDGPHPGVESFTVFLLVILKDRS